MSNDFDIVALTETWLGTTLDKKCIGELVPDGYKIKHCPRPGGRRAGGIALIYKSAISFRLLGSSKNRDFTQFEYMDCNLEVEGLPLRLAVAYRPPPSKN